MILSIDAEKAIARPQHLLLFCLFPKTVKGCTIVHRGGKGNPSRAKEIIEQSNLHKKSCFNHPYRKQRSYHQVKGLDKKQQPWDRRTVIALQPVSWGPSFHHQTPFQLRLLRTGWARAGYFTHSRGLGVGMRALSLAGGGGEVLATVPNRTTAVDRGSPGLRTRPFTSTVVALSRSVRRCGQRASERDHIRSLGWILVPSVGSGVHPAERPGRGGLSLGLGRERALLPVCGITRAHLLQPHEQATCPGWGSHWKRRVLECRTPVPRALTHLSPK